MYVIYECTVSKYDMILQMDTYRIGIMKDFRRRDKWAILSKRKHYVIPVIHLTIIG